MLEYFDLQEPNELASPEHDKWTIKCCNKVDNMCNRITTMQTSTHEILLEWQTYKGETKKSRDKHGGSIGGAQIWYPIYK